jgi:hypothetical protein
MANLDTSSLDPLKGAAHEASSQVASMTSAAPTLLNELRQNLTSIFAKDNPFIAERGQALETFLNAPSKSRVDVLPQNMAKVEGSNLNLSPTQQDAITTSRFNASLVPLAGLNQIVTGLYGNIPSMVDSAGNIYNAQIGAAKIKADQARQAYADAFAELREQEASRQFEAELAERMRQFDVSQRNSGGGGGGGISGLDSLFDFGGGSATVSRSGFFEDEADDGGFQHIEDNGNWQYGDRPSAPSPTQWALPKVTGGDAFNTIQNLLGSLSAKISGDVQKTRNKLQI